MSWQYTTPDNRLDDEDAGDNICEDCGELIPYPKHLCRHCADQRRYDEGMMDTE